jgi:diaminohydroxyphosphoribosylaminopyrimidine deaminase/5-amino-6-(5-phosphoribosylamino)uracil reductase
VDDALHGKHDSRSAQDARFMSLALTLGRRGLGRTWPNPAVGAVIVRDEDGVPVIVGRGATQPGGRPHAETEAIRQAGERARGATLYVTLEPCSHHGKTPPCADAIIAAGISHVVSAIEDPNPEVAGRGHARLREAGIVVTVGIGAEEARRAHAGHIMRVTNGRPYIFLKLAVSADGKVGLAGRKPVAITGQAAWERVHMMRAQHDAVLTGIGTVVSDNPLLTCRLPGMATRSPVRLVLDSDLRLPIASKLVSSAKTTPLWVMCSSQARQDREIALADKGAEVFRVACNEGKLDLMEVFRLLASRGITRLMVESGPKIAAAVINAGIADEIALFRAEKTVGSDGLDALDDMLLTAITGSPRFVLRDNDTVGDDRLEVYERT